MSNGEQALLINVGRYYRANSHGQRMTPSGTRRVLDCFSRASNLPKEITGAHMLRHTAGTRLYEKTGDLNKVAQFLGYSNINTSSVYAKLSADALGALINLMDED